MAQIVRINLGALVQPKKGSDKADFYTGSYEKYDLKVGGGIDTEDALLVYTDGKGGILAVTFAGQALPFVVKRNPEPGLAARLKEVYTRHLQGSILRVSGERPKIR